MEANDKSLRDKYELIRLRNSKDNKIYFDRKYNEINNISLDHSNITFSKSTFIEMEIEYFSKIFAELKSKRAFNDIARVESYILFLNDKKNSIESGCIYNSQLSCKYGKEELKKIYYNSTKFINCDIDSWLYWFGGIQCKSPNKIKWILLNRQGKPHKTTLREFLSKLLIKIPTQKIIDTFFVDENGYTIKLAKPKKDEFSNYFSEIENLI